MLAEISGTLLKSRTNAEIDGINTIKSSYAERTFGITFIAKKELLPSILDEHLTQNMP